MYDCCKSKPNVEEDGLPLTGLPVFSSLKQYITILQPLNSENRHNVRRIKTLVCSYNDVIFNQS